MLACGSSHIDMSVSPQTTGATHNCPLRIHQFSASRDAKVYGFRFSLQKERFSRRLKFVVSAELSKSLSRNIGLDSQVMLTLLMLMLLCLISVEFESLV